MLGAVGSAAATKVVSTRSSSSAPVAVVAKKGKRGPTGQQGPAGPKGALGDTGPPGQAGPFVDTVPSGKSESGIFGTSGTSAAGTVASASISFGIPLASAPTAHYVLASAVSPPAGCEGDYTNPGADPGNLCVFQGYGNNNLSFIGFVDAQNGSNSSIADKQGDLITYFAASGGIFYDHGVWVVTAP